MGPAPRPAAAAAPEPAAREAPRPGDGPTTAPAAAPAPLKLAGDTIEGPLRDLLERAHAGGEPVTVEVRKTSFTGRIFRMMLQEGWIALEHPDGRRRAFIIIEGGRIRSDSGEELPLPGGAGR